MKSKEKKLKALIAKLREIEPLRDHSDSFWKFYLKLNARGSWELLRITLYNKNYYFSFAGSNLNFSYPGHEQVDRENFIPWESKEMDWILSLTPKAINEIIKNPVTYAEKIYRELPLKYRDGFVPRKFLMNYVPDLYRPEKEMGTRKADKIIRWVEKNREGRDYYLKSMTLNLYLKYCRVAYYANKKKLGIRGAKSGLELYKVFADNRHEGLLDIDPNSPEAFEKWFQGGRRGGHPWEIYRGGNTTHIDLGVQHHEVFGWSIFLNAPSTSRMVECVNIALAFIEEDLAFEFSNSKSYRQRLLGLDNVGIVTEWFSTHRANQSYPEDLDVYDCIHLTDLNKTEQRKIAQVTSWLPLKLILPQAL